MKRDYPIILGNNKEKPTKVVIGYKSQIFLDGVDVTILGLKEDAEYTEDCTNEEFIEMLDGREYATLHFCSVNAIDSMISCLQKAKKLME